MVPPRHERRKPRQNRAGPPYSIGASPSERGGDPALSTWERSLDSVPTMTTPGHARKSCTFGSAEDHSDIRIQRGVHWIIFPPGSCRSWVAACGREGASHP